MEWFVYMVLTIIINLLLGLLETFCHEVGWLHLTDRERNVVLGNHFWVQWQEFRLVGLAVFKFTKATHDTCTISFLFAIFIKAHTELNGKPEQRS